MFKFLQRSPFAESRADASSDESELAARANEAPLSGQIGAGQASSAFAAIAAASPGSVTFLAAPETAGHRDAVRAGLEAAAHVGLPGRSAVIVYDASVGSLKALRLETGDAAVLSDGVAQAIEMLALTLPSAFASDSYRAARMALDEELRSSHDAQVDALKRRAAASNIGLLQTPLGYAIAPIHDSRVVAPEVVKALPEALRAEVDGKLAAFEAELSRVLENRSALQLAYATARRDLDRETAALAVRAALSRLEARFSSEGEAKAYLSGLRADLVHNAALFLPDDAASPTARPRAPAELAADPKLARFRAELACRQPQAPLVHIRALDRASLIGGVREPAGVPATPACVQLGGLTRAGRGIAVVALDDLLAETGSWPLLRRMVRAGSAVPIVTGGEHPRLSTLDLPLDCRIVITGTAEAYAAWCGRDATIESFVPLVRAFEPTIPSTQEARQLFARHAAAIAAGLKQAPLDAATLADLIEARSRIEGRQRALSTDLDAVRILLLARAAHATQSSAEARDEPQDRPAAGRTPANPGEPPAIKAAA